MKQTDYKEFYDLVVPRLFEVSEYQKLMCGKIENLGKNVEQRIGIAKRFFSLSNLNGCHYDWDGDCKKHDIRRCQCCTAQAWEVIETVEDKGFTIGIATAMMRTNWRKKYGHTW